MSGPLQSLAVSRTLWLVVAPPLVAFVWQLATGLRRAGVANDPWPRRIAVGAILVASAATLGHALGLAQAPEGTQALVEYTVGGARLGALEAGFGLVFDRLSGTASSLSCAVALGVAALIASRGVDRRRWQVWAWLELSLAGALLSFLADGFATTLLGWGLAVSAAAWLAGWSDPRAGAVRATRGALAIVAMLVGDALLLRGFYTTLALAAFLVASVAMSASPPPPGAPLALSALDCGATTGVLGPFLLLRLAFLVPRSPGAAWMVAVVVGAWLVLIGRRALAAPAGPWRWIVLAGGAPAALVLVALSVDGVQGGLLVLVSAGLVSALLLGVAGARLSPPSPAPRGPSVERALLEHAPEAGAPLLMAFERWVVDAITGSVGVLVRALAWTLARFDAHV